MSTVATTFAATRARRPHGRVTKNGGNSAREKSQKRPNCQWRPAILQPRCIFFPRAANHILTETQPHGIIRTCLHGVVQSYERVIPDRVRAASIPAERRREGTVIPRSAISGQGWRRLPVRAYRNRGTGARRAIRAANVPALCPFPFPSFFPRVDMTPGRSIAAGRTPQRNAFRSTLRPLGIAVL